MHLELRLAAAEGGEGVQRDELPVAQRQSGPVVYLAEGPGHDLVAEFGADACERVDDAAPAVDALAGDAGEDLHAAVEALLAGLGLRLRRGAQCCIPLMGMPVSRARIRKSSRPRPEAA